MRTDRLFADRQVFSFEIFPPKTDYPIKTIYDTLDGLKDLSPDFISVTYGAGTKDDGGLTVDITSRIIDDYGFIGVAHLPGRNLTCEQMGGILRQLKERGIENVLALRGNDNPDVEPVGDFIHGSDVVSFVRENSDMNIIGACYPEGHNDSDTLAEDIRNLKVKVDAGCSQLISQLFLDNEFFYAFLERCDIAGINVPIQAGIMPVVNKAQIMRMVTMCGVQIPKRLIRILDRYSYKPEALRDAGLAYAIDQIVDLAANDVDGIHLYTMNHPDDARQIKLAVSNIFH